jgi:hypothetical protein
MNFNLIPLSEIEAGLNDFQFIETNNPEIPIMGRVIIGTVEPEDTPDMKMLVLEIGLEQSNKAEEYEWYWEITMRDISTTEIVSKNHNTGFTAQYKRSCRGCSVIPMEIQGHNLADLSPRIVEDITKNFDL